MRTSSSSLFANCSNTFRLPKEIIIIVKTNFPSVQLVPYHSFANLNFMNVHFIYRIYYYFISSVLPDTCLAYAHSYLIAWKSRVMSFSPFLLSPFLHSCCSICIFFCSFYPIRKALLTIHLSSGTPCIISVHYREISSFHSQTVENQISYFLFFLFLGINASFTFPKWLKIFFIQSVFGGLGRMSTQKISVLLHGIFLCFDTAITNLSYLPLFFQIHVSSLTTLFHLN